MRPLLTQIRGQLPNETVSFGLLLRGKVLEAKTEYVEAAGRPKKRLRKNPEIFFIAFFGTPMSRCYTSYSRRGEIMELW
jgi:hypothetical protein